MDFIKSEPNSDCETYVTLSHSENEVISIKEEEDPLLITSSVMNNGDEVSSMSLLYC
jgi:hypothetical protein